MEYNQESFINVYKDATGLISKHHDEVTIFDGVNLDLDISKYQRLDDLGLLKVFTVRSEGILVGYSSFFLSSHTHHKNTVHAHMDTIYIHPKFRGIGADFANYCDDQLVYCDVNFVHRGFPSDNNWGEKLIDYGYEEKEITYIKEIA